MAGATADEPAELNGGFVGLDHRRRSRAEAPAVQGRSHGAAAELPTPRDLVVGWMHRILTGSGAVGLVFEDDADAARAAMVFLTPNL